MVLDVKGFTEWNENQKCQNMNAEESAIIGVGDDAQESVFLKLSNYWIAVPKT